MEPGHSHASPPPRRPGRPPRTRPDGAPVVGSAADSDTRRGILDVAERLFADQGYTPTTIKDIADAARVNSALIYYYYESKERLYQACVERFVLQLADTALERLEPSATPDEVVRAIVAAQAAMMITRPHIPRLLVREMVDWQASHVGGALNKLSEGMFQRLRAAIETGQSGGHYRRDLSPTFAAISTISQIAYLAIARPVVGIILGQGPRGVTDDEARAFATHAADFALAALRAPDDPGALHQPNDSTLSPPRRPEPALT